MPSEDFIGLQVSRPSMRKAAGENSAVSFSNSCLETNFVVIRRLVGTLLAPLTSKSVSTF